MFGTIACGETWLWQEEGFGLGMDVMMKEGYGGGVGGGQYEPLGAGNCRFITSFVKTGSGLPNRTKTQQKASGACLRRYAEGPACLSDDTRTSVGDGRPRGEKS